jgi:small subunit ribosomal protein S20
MRTYVKRVRKHLEDKDLEGAQKWLPLAVQAIDKAAGRGVVHRNTAARYVSRLTVAVSKAAA